MSTKVVYCARCGEVELANMNYQKQMAKTNEKWHCPMCGGYADWVGEYSPCLVCGEPTSHEIEDCEHCGINQEAMYHAIHGNIDAQNYVRAQCEADD